MYKLRLFVHTYAYALRIYKLLTMKAIRTESMDPGKKSRFREKANEYMNRAEVLQKNIDAAKVRKFLDEAKRFCNSLDFQCRARFFDKKETNIMYAVLATLQPVLEY